MKDVDDQKSGQVITGFGKRAKDAETVEISDEEVSEHTPVASDRAEARPSVYAQVPQAVVMDERAENAALDHLAASPLSALLPVLGDSRSLVRWRTRLEERAAELQAVASVADREGREDADTAEQAMLQQVITWLGGHAATGSLHREQSDEAEIFTGIFALGRLYYEMGYLVAAERLFVGLAASQPEMQVARLGVAVVALDRGLYPEAEAGFKALIEDDHFAVFALVGLAATFVATRQVARAKSLLVQVARVLERFPETKFVALRRFWEALALRCDGQ